MIIKKIQHIFEEMANRVIDKDEFERLKLIHFLWLIFSGLICMLSFAIYNFIYHDYKIVVVLLGFSAILASLFYFIEKKTDPRILYNLAALIYIFLISYFVLYVDAYDARILWAYVFPVASVLLFGSRLGLIWSTIMFLVIILCLSLIFQANDIRRYDFIVRFFATYWVVMAITEWLEYYRNKYQQDLLKSHKLLQEKHKLLKNEMAEKIILESKLTTMAHTDPLTGLFNRRHFWNEGGKELERSRRYDFPICLAVLDIDNFKEINDSLGHPAGDEVLRILARKSTYILRESDFLARIGGDEFAFLLVHVNKEEAYKKIQSFHKEVSSAQIKALKNGKKLQVSIGLACFDKENMENINDLFKLADNALYQAKKSGKNQVSIIL